ncbi:hypothetical protein FACS1894120_2030 [Clostridia bacterium]|nr:hypothetical protein FACS1894120_2030 [Clostridia bacterium]
MNIVRVRQYVIYVDTTSLDEPVHVNVNIKDPQKSNHTKLWMDKDGNSKIAKPNGCLSKATGKEIKEIKAAIKNSKDDIINMWAEKHGAENIQYFDKFAVFVERVK